MLTEGCRAIAIPLQERGKDNFFVLVFYSHEELNSAEAANHVLETTRALVDKVQGTPSVNLMIGMSPRKCKLRRIARAQAGGSHMTRVSCSHDSRLLQKSSAVRKPDFCPNLPVCDPCASADSGTR